jgi:UDP-glucose 4-epimerase
MNLLIIGSEGFIGKHLVEFFKKKDFVVGADLLDVPSQSYSYVKISRLSPEFDEIFKTYRFEVCINASGSGNVNYSMTHPVLDFESNSLDTIRLLDAIRRHQPDCRYLHISSAAVYGNPEHLPITETATLSPISPYGWHKLIAEKICAEFHSIYKIPIAVVRPFSVFGPGLKKQLLWDLHIKSKNATDHSVELWGTGTESRDFIAIDSVLEVFRCIIDNSSFDGDIYNVANGVEVSIKEIASAFLRQWNPKLRLVFNAKGRSGDPQNWKADISKIEALGYKPALDFQPALVKTIQWLRSLN